MNELPGRYWGEPRSSLELALAELTRFFREYRVWFNQKLPLPVITIQSAGGLNALGWYSRKRWKQSDLGNLLDEINICPEHLAGGTLETGHTMVHEMVHYANARVGKNDCNINQYHNGHFKLLAEQVGLDCGPERHPRFGWGITRLTPRSIQRIEAIGLDDSAFTLFRSSFVLTGKKSKRRERGPTLQAWICDCKDVPHVWRAFGYPHRAKCMDCGSFYRKFEVIPKQNPNPEAT